MEDAPGRPGRCRLCDARGTRVFHELAEVPVHSNRLLPSPEEALAQPRGQLRLAFCDRCGFIQNEAFDPALQQFDEGYEDSQGHSPRFRRFAEELVDHLVERYGLRGRPVLEVGCGSGEFLALLCDRTGGEGVGIDPAVRAGPPSQTEGPQLRLFAERYGREHAGLEAALVVCRHTLEHLVDPRGLVAMLRRNLARRDETIVYVEVPDTTRILAEQAFWDVYYEHCSYFTVGTLARLFARSGFEILDLRKGYDEQYLMLEARPASRIQPGTETTLEDVALQETTQLVEGFRSGVAKTLEQWRHRLMTWRRAGRRVVLWGAGSKAVGFLTSLEAGDEVAGIVDINPRKQGTFQAGTGHAIVGPERLGEIRPEVVVLMNPIYRDEIRGQLASLGLSPELHAL